MSSCRSSSVLRDIGLPLRLRGHESVVDAQLGKSPACLALYRAGRASQNPRHLCLAQILEKTQHHYGALARGKRPSALHRASRSSTTSVSSATRLRSGGSPIVTSL